MHPLVPRVVVETEIGEGWSAPGVAVTGIIRSSHCGDTHIVVNSCLLPRGRCKSIFLAMLWGPVAAYDQVMRIEEYLHASLSCFVSPSLRDVPFDSCRNQL